MNATFYEYKTGIYPGARWIDRIAEAFRSAHRDFRYQLIADLEVIGNGGRVRWVSGRPGEPPVYAGTDFII